MIQQQGRLQKISSLVSLIFVMKVITITADLKLITSMWDGIVTSPSVSGDNLSNS
jgi:hypothetical protein